MQRASTIFLQAVTILIGILTFALFLWEPHLEGRNADATLFQIYFNDPFLIFVYAGSIPFFVALYHAIKVLGYIGRSEVFSERSVRAVRTIKHCALMTAGAIAAVDAYLMIMARLLHSTDDAAGAIALGIVAAFASVVIAATASVLEKILQRGNDLRM